ncbi:MAG TPA: cytochrome c oxidase assembly protein [Devosia sp.]|nr:cytochrome c oxidase assembly protein [Devosia sp.]
MTAIALQRGGSRAGWISLVAALAVLAGLWCGPLLPLSRTAFSAHMLLHLGLVVVAAPLLGLALAAHLPSPRGFANALGWYLLAGAFEMVAVWGWHIPLLHDAAGHNLPLFAVEQASFLAGGTALWAALWTARTPAAALAAAITAFFAFAHTSMFGLLLSLVPRLIYDPNLCQGAFGLDRLDDQHLGGALMAVSGLVYLAAAAVLCVRVLR